jgi:hypothetical protein
MGSQPGGPRYACEVRLMGSAVPPNKGMKLTKLSAAPTLAPQAALRPEVPPHARAAGMDAGTASQLIPGVRWTREKRMRRTTTEPSMTAAWWIPFSFRSAQDLPRERGD